MRARKEYFLSLRINRRQLNRVIIDSHYREKHGESMDDLLILRLIKKLNGGIFSIDEIRGDFHFLKVEPVLFSGDPYRLVLVIHASEDYVGVINAFRVDRK